MRDHFVHMPKTGGTWVGRTLLGTGSHHVPAAERPSPSWGILRDPWSWYGSLYLHATRPGVPREHELATWGGGRTDFRSVLWGWTHPAGRVPNERPSVLIQRPTVDEVDYTAAGLWTVLTRWYFGGATLLLDHHRLYDALPLLGVHPRPDEHPPTNVARQGQHPPWDDEMRAWVREADGDLIGRWGLTFYAPMATLAVRP